jgi:hypothetical protein
MRDIFWLLDKAPQPIPGYPAFVPGDQVLVNKLNEYLSNPLTEPQLMFGVGDFPGTDDGHGTGEGQAWQLEDGRLRHFIICNDFLISLTEAYQI